MGQGGRSPGSGIRDPKDALLSSRPEGLCHQRGSPAARPQALGSEDRARPAGLSPREFDREGGANGRGRCQHLDGGGRGRTSQTPAASTHPAPPSPMQPQKEGQGAASSASPPSLRLGRRCTPRPGRPRRPLSPLARIPEAPDTAITLNGNAPRRSVLPLRPAWIRMEPATSSGETPKRKKWSWGPRRRQDSEASREPQAAEERGHDARGLPTDLGSERKKGLRLGFSSTKLCSQLANAQSAQESCGLGAPGPRQPGEKSPRRASYAARRPRGAPALWLPRSLARSLARSAPAARPLARLSAALSAAASSAPLQPPPPPPGGSRPR